MKQQIYFNDFNNNLESIIQMNEFSNVLIVCSKRIKNSQFSNNENYIFFDCYEYNPKIKDVERLVSLILHMKPDVVVAIGGGTAIDLAKQASLLSESNKGSIKEHIIKKSYVTTDSTVPMIAIPTTAGTGSESTKFSVVYIDGIKFSVEHDLMIPNFVILDPRLLSGCPKHIIASTAIDALTQSIESIWSVHSTSESRNHASESIKLINENLYEAYKTQYKDNDVALNMINAANLSGKAINISKTTAPHAISYPLTSYHDVPHGHAVGMIIPKFFSINDKVNDNTLNDKRGVDYVKDTMKYVYSLFNCSDNISMSEYFTSLMTDLSLETNFKKIGVSSDNDIKNILSDVNLSRLQNNPVIVSKQEIKQIFL